MKNRITPILYLLFLMATTTAWSQQHAIKLNLPSLVVGNFSAGYEYSIGDKASVQLGIGILPSRNLSSTNAIVSLIINDTDASRFADDIRFSGWSVTPEFRFYPFKSDMDLHGFYVAPALRASRYAVKTDYSYTTSSGEVNTLAAKGSLTGFGANVIIGYNIPIAEELALDIFLGGGLNAARFGVSLKDDGLVAEDYREVEEEVLNEFGRDPEDFTDIISDNGINFGFYLPTPTIRTGLALGYTF